MARKRMGMGDALASRPSSAPLGAGAGAQVGHGTRIGVGHECDWLRGHVK
jgi:hypothetical protein